MSRLRNVRSSRAMEVAPAEMNADGVEPAPPEPADWTALADDQVLRGEMRKQLVGALRHLPAVYRVPVLLRDIHGLSTEEASAILHVKPQTLKSRLHRGRLILRKHLGDFAGGLELHTREAVN
jgi:RNA polymerase sigma-70 factor (ECF subfamily)